MNPDERTYYNRAETARILGVSHRELRRWQDACSEPGHPLHGMTLFVPTRRGLPWAPRAVRYHAKQVELMDEALADWSRARENDRYWARLADGIGQITLQRAIARGIVSRPVEETHETP